MLWFGSVFLSGVVTFAHLLVSVSESGLVFWVMKIVVFTNFKHLDIMDVYGLLWMCMTPLPEYKWIRGMYTSYLLNIVHSTSGFSA